MSLPVTATAVSGALVLETEMVREQAFWFSDWGPAAVGLAR